MEEDDSEGSEEADDGIDGSNDQARRNQAENYHQRPGTLSIFFIRCVKKVCCPLQTFVVIRLLYEVLPTSTGPFYEALCDISTKTLLGFAFLSTSGEDIFPWLLLHVFPACVG